jgi:integrase
MKKADAMAKPLGLFQRGTVWWLRVMIPLDLQGSYGGRKKLVSSLRTGDRAEAGLKAAQRHAELLAEFAEKRRSLNPEPVARITPELGVSLAAGIRTQLLGWDERLRSSPATAEAWLSFTRAFDPGNLSTLRIGPPVPAATPSPAELEALAKLSPLDGVTPSQLRRLAEVNTDRDDAAALMLATRKLSHVVPLADHEARRLGLLVDWKAPEARPVLVECLRAYRKAMAAIVARDEGEDVETPPAPTVGATKAPPTLRDILATWKEAKRRSADSIRACERALEGFEQHAGTPPVAKITRAHGVEFRSWLLAQPISSKTAHDRFTWVRALLRFASDDMGIIDRQPWQKLVIEHKTEAPRRPWTPAEIQGFFALPVFQSYALPKLVDAGGAAAYWVPLLGLYTGARVGELCQLRAEDVAQDAAGPMLRITDEGEGAKLKTAGSRRDVPLHPELIRLGFLDYVESVRKLGHVSLWPRMRFRKGKPGAFFSEWFRKARDTVPGGVPDFHALRHTARTALTESGIAESIKDRITGHSVRGSAGTRVYEHPVAEIRRAVESISYPGLSLPRVFKEGAPNSV